MKVLITESQLKHIINESDGWDNATTSEDWLDWKAEREEAANKMQQCKKHVLTSVHKFNSCMTSIKQEIIEQYPSLRSASMFSWADDMEGLTLHEASWAQRERERMASPDYNPQDYIDDMQRRADSNRDQRFQQVRDRHERRRENYAHLKPIMRLYRSINEALFKSERIKFNTQQQGVSGVNEFLDSTQFLTAHTEGVDKYIIESIKGCVKRLHDADIEKRSSSYLAMENKWYDMLDHQPTQIVRH